jgi:hypothetical protein
VEIIDLVFLWKTSTSGGGNCPALYKTEGGYVVQGKRLGAAARARLRDLGADEDALYVPADVLDRLANPA